MLISLEATVIVSSLDYLECRDLVRRLEERMAGMRSAYPLTVDEEELIKQGLPIPAIKSMRERTGMSLIQAKHTADLYRDKLANDKEIKRIRAGVATEILEEMQPILNWLKRQV